MKIKKTIKSFALLALLLNTASCETFRKIDFRRMDPRLLFGKKVYFDSKLDSLNNVQMLNIRFFFDGELEGHGIKRNNDGNIVDAQNIKIKSKWQGNKGTLQFDYYHDNQHLDSRTWLITLNPNGTFEAIGHDIIGQAHGKHSGNASQIIYDLMLPDEYNRKIEHHFEDKIYLVDEKSAIMIKKVGKYYRPDSTWIFSIKKISKEAPKASDSKGNVDVKKVEQSQMPPLSALSNLPAELAKFRPNQKLIVQPDE